MREREKKQTNTTNNHFANGEKKWHISQIFFLFCFCSSKMNSNILSDPRVGGKIIIRGVRCGRVNLSWRCYKVRIIKELVCT